MLDNLTSDDLCHIKEIIIQSGIFSHCLNCEASVVTVVTIFTFGLISFTEILLNPTKCIVH